MTRIARLLAAITAFGLAIQIGFSQSGGPPGGIVRVLAIDPSAPATLYAGTEGNGVFKSTNGGAGWLAVNSKNFREGITIVWRKT